MRKLGNKIEKILAIDSQNFKLTVKFADGSSGCVDLSAYFAHPKGLASEIVKGQFFDKCFLESGALAWPNGLEFCPDALKQKLISTKKHRAA
jgi:hypothetical protein